MTDARDNRAHRAGRTAAAVLMVVATLVMAPFVAWAAGTPAGTTIRNQATAHYQVPGRAATTTLSNEVVTVVAATCVPSVVPDGSALIPGQSVVGLPGTTQVLDYRLTNAGNATFSFDLSTTVHPDSTQAPTSVVVYVDEDGNGVVGSGDSVVTGLNDVAADQTTKLLIEVELPSDPSTSGGVILLDLIASCRAQPSQTDTGNHARIEIGAGGIARETKRATPSSGQTVLPGDDVDYEMFFTANDVALLDVTVTDVLDPRLGTPTAVTEGTIVDGISGESADASWSFDATSRELVWSLPVVPAGMTVRLTFRGRVSPDALADSAIENSADIAWTGESVGNQRTNTTSHLVQQTCGVSVTPDGTVAAPGATRATAPGGTVVIPYSVTNTGNATFDLTLRTELLPESTTAPASSEFVWDQDGNGTHDAGEPVVTQLTAVPPSASRNLLLVVQTSSAAIADDVIYLDLIAACDGDPSVRDEGNVARVQVPSGGIEGLAKTASQAAGTPLAPGDPVGYDVRFSAVDLDLESVTIEDVIDEDLDAPTGFTSGVVSDPDTGLTATAIGTYDAASRTLTWTIDRVPATMTVNLTVDTRVRADALSTDAIDNQAVVTWFGASQGSEGTGTVNHPVAGVCQLSLTPDGTTDDPAYDRVAHPGDVIALPYTLANTGNGTFDFDVTLDSLAGTTADLVEARVVRDLDGDGVLDAGEPTVSDLVGIGPGETVALLLVVDVTGGPSTAGQALIDVTGACTSEPSVSDTGNVAVITVPSGGIVDVTKSADPGAEQGLYPGADVRYTISFRAEERDLRDVVVRDPLDPRLGMARDVTTGTITDPASGLTTEVTASTRDDEIVWTLDEIPSGMTVTLGFTATVGDDAPAGETVTNLVCVVSRNFAEVCSDAVRHDVEQLEILLEKRAATNVITVGEDVTYLLDVVNPSSTVPLRLVVVVDELPSGVRYRNGSSELVSEDGSATTIDASLEGNTVSWDVSPLEPGERKTIRFRALVTVEALDAESLVNSAEARGLHSSGAVAAASADSIATAVDPGVFRASAVLLGRVFIDHDADGLYDEGLDEPIPDVRLFMADGVFTLSDDQGRYTFQGRTPGVDVVRVDASTLPPRLLQSTPHQDGPGTWRLRLQAGTLHRLDVPLVLPEVALEVEQTEPDTDTDIRRSRITIEASAWNLPPAEHLALIVELAAGERYVADSLIVDGLVAEPPGRTARGLVIPLADAQPHRISLEVAHDGPAEFTRDRIGLVGMFPEPSLLYGSDAALDILRTSQATQAAAAPRVRDRVGVLFLSPFAGSVVQDRDAIGVSVDMSLDAEVELYVAGQRVDDTAIGRRTYDRGFARQTFDWVGVELSPGPNRLRAVVTSADGEQTERSIVVYRSGPTDRVEIVPEAPLEADSVKNLSLVLRAADAWGNPPDRDVLTIEVEGAVPSSLDARPQQVGFQVRLREGRGTLTLQPFTQAGDFTVSVLVDGEFRPHTFEVRTPVRPPIAVGIASLGVGYRTSGDASGMHFGYDGRFFAQASLADGSQLTAALNARFRPVGLYGDPYRGFPVPGADQPLRGEAVSRHGVYLRWERDRTFLAYGDFETPGLGPLSSLGRAYTGAHGAYLDPQGWEIRGFAAVAPVDVPIDGHEIQADGTSVYRLPVAPVEPGSVRVRIIKRDRFDDTIVDDDDPRTGTLQPLLHFTVDERVGIVRLSRPLPLRDADGHRYALVVAFTPVDAADRPHAVQFGAQAAYDWEALTFHVGGYRVTGTDGNATGVVSSGALWEGESGRATAELVYGADDGSGGVGLHLAGSNRFDAFTVASRYEFRSAGFRSADVRDGSRAGHDAEATLGYDVDPRWTMSLNGRASYRSESDRLAWGTTALAGYQGDADWIFDEQVVGRRPTGRLGVEFSDAGVRAIVAGGLDDLFGADGSGVLVTHRQGLGATVVSTSEFVASYRILENLELRVIESIDWGVQQSFSVGLEQVVNHHDVVSAACASTECQAPDDRTSLGRTTVTAQYRTVGGVPDDAGQALLGVASQFPITTELTVDASAEGTIDLNDRERNEVVVGAGATYQTRDIDADARFEVRFADALKVTMGVGTTFAWDRDLFGSVTFDYLHDAASTPRNGVTFGVAAALRNESLDLLTTHEARWGSLAAGGRAELWGDIRASYPVDVAWDLRGGYLYRWRQDASLMDMIALGTTASPWDGGQVTAMGRVFHDWTEGDLAAGLTLEASQRLGCGVYGVAGVNLFNRFGISTPSIYTDPGPYVRVDVVFDEQWRCGTGSIEGTVFLDTDEDGSFGAAEAGIAGVHVSLLAEDGTTHETLVTGEGGHYRFERVPADTLFNVVVDLPGPYPRFSAGDPHARESSTGPIVTGPGAPVENVDVGIVPADGGGTR